MFAPAMAIFSRSPQRKSSVAVRQGMSHGSSAFFSSLLFHDFAFLFLFPRRGCSVVQPLCLGIRLTCAAASSHAASRPLLFPGRTSDTDAVPLKPAAAMHLSA